MAKINEKNRYKTYREFKDNHNREQYLKDINVTKFRKIYTKFRLGILDIKANKQFYKPEIDVKCPTCEEGIEDERHILLICKTYNYLREKYITKHWSNIYTPLRDILNTKDPEKIKDTAMFLYYMAKRRELITNN